MNYKFYLRILLHSRDKEEIQVKKCKWKSYVNTNKKSRDIEGRMRETNTHTIGALKGTKREIKGEFI